jgi:DnaJ-class molecular chaperone
MRYHPDVILKTESIPKERDDASKDFARINAAYEMLTGGGVGGGGGELVDRW